MPAVSNNALFKEVRDLGIVDENALNAAYKRSTEKKESLSDILIKDGLGSSPHYKQLDSEGSFLCLAGDDKVRDEHWFWNILIRMF